MSHNSEQVAQKRAKTMNERGVKREHAEMSTSQMGLGLSAQASSAPPATPAQPTYTYSASELRKLQSDLNRPLSVEETALLPNKQVYMEGCRVVTIANDVFGFDGWKCDVRSLKIEDEHRDGACYYVMASACVRVTLKNGVTFHDVRFSSNSRASLASRASFS
jgi:recombination DNA repair RAD52 pathway protein